MFSFLSTLLTLSLVTSSLGLSQHPERCQTTANQRRRTDGCGQAPSVTPGDFKNYSTSAGREYRVWLPANYDSDKATPLILSYHGANRDMTHQIDLDKLTDPLFNKDHIVVYLQGKAVSVAQSLMISFHVANSQKEDPSRPTHTTWEGAPGSSVNDIKFTNDVLDEVSGELCVDEKRIFATGKSQGGGFVGRLACDSGLSARIAAFAPVSGAY